MNDVAAAYTATARAWEDGPARVYDRLADALVALSPAPMAGRRVLDLGAGTGAGSRAVARAGGRAVALDPALGMLLVERAARPPAVVGDGRSLPFRAASLDGVVAAFSLNHLADPVPALREAARMTAPGGPILASAYAAHDDHPVKHTVVAALVDRGWREPDWYRHVRMVATPALATVERATATARAAGLDATVHAFEVSFSELSATALVAWRLGLAQHAPFVASMAASERAALTADAVARLGTDWPPLVRSLIVVTALRP